MTFAEWGDHNTGHSVQKLRHHIANSSLNYLDLEIASSPRVKETVHRVRPLRSKTPCLMPSRKPPQRAQDSTDYADDGQGCARDDNQEYYERIPRSVPGLPHELKRYHQPHGGLPHSVERRRRERVRRTGCLSGDLYLSLTFVFGEAYTQEYRIYAPLQRYFGNNPRHHCLNRSSCTACWADRRIFIS